MLAAIGTLDMVGLLTCMGTLHHAVKLTLASAG